MEDRLFRQADSEATGKRRYPLGAEIIGDRASFRVWAPSRMKMWVVGPDGAEYPMAAEEGGYFSAEIAGIEAGWRYRFRLDGVTDPAPDPASRYQPEGPDGPSEIVDHGSYSWREEGWAGVDIDTAVLYEMHVGTFTEEGTYAAAADKLAFLRDIGITLIEMMPINEFPGAFGWGYDGVLPFSPFHRYGRPDDLRAFVDEAHRLGIGVILDVVYNHFGAGNRFHDFTPDYFTDRYWNEWGSSINFDGQGAAGVREMVCCNAAYWIDEFRFDGLRLDATQALYDESDDHIIAAIARSARLAAGERKIYVVAENEPQKPEIVRPSGRGGYGLDALWNDDFHHSAMVALSGRNEAYYHDHCGRAQEFVSAAKFGYLFQGQRYDWQDTPRGRPGLDLVPFNFVHFLQNHDQIANSGSGPRLQGYASPARIRAITALLFLGPQTPMLFQGQEFGATTPFYYFADTSGEMADTVRTGRTEFLAQFPSLAHSEFAETMPVPHERQTFLRSTLDWSECERQAHACALHRDLIRLRKETGVITEAGRRGRAMLDGSCLSGSAFLLRYLSENPAEERLLFFNFGADLPIESLAEPLAAPPEGMQWEICWSSESAVYGGSGQRAIDHQQRWLLSADSALMLRPVEAERRTLPSRKRLENWQRSLSGFSSGHLDSAKD